MAIAAKIGMAVLTNEHWDDAAVFVADTTEAAMAKAEAFARQCWEEWADEDATWDDYCDSPEFPFVWLPANAPFGLGG